MRRPLTEKPVRGGAPSSRERAEAFFSRAKELTQQAEVETLPMRQQLLRDSARKATALAEAEVRYGSSKQRSPS
jgi:hypothetical protein